MRKRIETKERKAAMAWWKTLRYDNKTYLIDKNKGGVVGEKRLPQELTGREIELIYSTIQRSESNNRMTQ